MKQGKAFLRKEKEARAQASQCEGGPNTMAGGGSGVFNSVALCKTCQVGFFGCGVLYTKEQLKNTSLVLVGRLYLR